PKTPPGGVPRHYEQTGVTDATPSSWINVYETGQQGQRIIVGRVPSYTEFWEGNPPTDLKPELRLSEVDEYLSKLSGLASPASSLRTLISTPVNQSFSPFPVPPKSIGIGGLGGFPIADPNSPRTRESDYFDKRINEGDAPISRSSPIGNCWEQICCIGLDVEKKEVTAVIQILQTFGYGGSLCNSTGFEGVGFWLVEPSIVEYVPNDWPSSPVNNPIPREGFCAASVRFIGSTKIPVADIPRNTNVIEGCLDSVHQYDARSLQYTASVPLSEEDLDFMLHCSAKSPRLPILHVVMGWNTEIYNEHYGGMKHQFWDNHSVVVQYPVTKLKQIRKECAVGILWEGCPRVLFSSVVRRATNPTTGKSFIDKLAIAITPAIVEGTRTHGGVMFCVLKGDANLRMQRTGILNPNSKVLESKHYKIGDLPNDRVITPFDLDNGNWMICAVFGPMKDPIEWDPARDMILTGNISTEVISCVGTVDSFAIPGIEVAGPHWVDYGRFNVNEEPNDSSPKGYTECTPPVVLEKVLPPFQFNALVFYPVGLNEKHQPDNFKSFGEDTPVIVLVPANGTVAETELEDKSIVASWQDYRSMITMLVKQGAIVIVTHRKQTSGTFFIVQILNELLENVAYSFPIVRSAPLFFVGHSVGGGMVARLLTKSALYAAEVPVSVIRRIRGGFLLAPTFLSGDVVIDAAPCCTMFGALDSQLGFIRLKCENNNPDSDGYSDYLVSPIRYYYQNYAPWSALILVDGGTHLRWIDWTADDFESKNINNTELAKQLVLDGPATGAIRTFQEHRSIFLSYLNYFFRTLVFAEENYLNFFFSPNMTPPDVEILPFEGPEKVKSQLHLQARLVGEESINNSTEKQSGFPGKSGARRKVIVDGVELQNSELVVNSFFLVSFPATYPIMDSRIVFASGAKVEFNFKLNLRYKINPSDVLRAQYTVLNAVNGLLKEKFKLSCSFTLDTTEVATFAISDIAKTNVGIILPNEVGGNSGSAKTYYGDMGTIEEILLPLSWIVQKCYGKEELIGDLRIRSISILCEFESGTIAQFGLGAVQILSVDTMKVVLP
ncbi:MAG: hypothetical protein HQ472_09860, partial [Ignavibacteria bacterium]|nr:hypothetical protein [Ignavibacteria bacterium]